MLTVGVTVRLLDPAPVQSPFILSFLVLHGAAYRANTPSAFHNEKMRC